MKLSRGFNIANAVTAMQGSYELLFFTGDQPSQEELIRIRDADSLSVYYSSQFSGSYIDNFMLGLGRTLVCSAYISKGSSIKQNGSGDIHDKWSLDIDFSINTETFIFQNEGIIGNLVMYDIQSTTYLHDASANLTSTKGLMFFSVGLPGSGADIELTRTDFKDGDQIRMNNISIEF